MFYDVFEELCKSKNKSCKKVSLELGLSNSTSSKWKRTGAVPSGETLTKISDYFNVSIDYLLGNETKKDPQPVPGADQMDEQLQQMLSLVEKMTDEERNNIISYMKFLAGSKDGGEEETKND